MCPVHLLRFGSYGAGFSLVDEAGNQGMGCNPPENIRSTRPIPSTHRPKAVVRIAVREEFVPREKSATVLIFSAYV